MEKILAVPCSFVNAESFEKYLNRREYQYKKGRYNKEKCYIIQIDNPMDAFWIGANSTIHQ